MAKFSYDPYEESEAVKQARQQAESLSQYKESQSVSDARNKMQQYETQKRADWTGGQYGTALQDTMNRINNREKFTYDVNADALYQQYKDRYMNQGRIAMQDTMGQAAALTGGYGNSYAAAVGNQAYQGYLQQLNDVVPELYNMAYNRYQQEGQNLQNQYNMYNDAYNREYGEYRDSVGDWNAEMARLTDMYNTERNVDRASFDADREYFTNAFQDQRSWEYGLYNDAYNRALQEYQLNKSKKGSGGGSSKKSSSSPPGKDAGDSGSKSSEMTHSDWGEAMSIIRKNEGTAAAQKELDELNKKKVLNSTNYGFASNGAFGYQGNHW